MKRKLLFFMAFVCVVSISSIVVQSVESSSSLLVLSDLEFIATADPENTEINCDDFYERETCATVTVKRPNGNTTKITVSGRRID